MHGLSETLMYMICGKNMHVDKKSISAIKLHVCIINERSMCVGHVRYAQLNHSLDCEQPIYIDVKMEVTQRAGHNYTAAFHNSVNLEIFDRRSCLDVHVHCFACTCMAKTIAIPGTTVYIYSYNTIDEGKSNNIMYM